MKCGKSVDSPETEYCYDCGRREHIYDRGIALFSYNQEIKESIYRFKYANKQEYGEFYGREMASCLGETVRSWQPDFLAPVPLHKSKLLTRGYNQAGILAEKLGDSLHIPVRENLLYRQTKTKPQKELNDYERKKNVESAFKMGEDIVKLKKIVLVDDIYTTGSTIDGCAKVLKENGANKVYYVSLSIGKGF